MTRQEEVQAKLERLRAWMSQEGYGTVILSTQANFAWITAGGDNHVLLTTEAGVGRVVLTTAGQYVLTSNIEAPRLADEELESLPFEILDAGWHVQDDAAALEKVAQGQWASDTEWPPDAANRGDDIAHLQYALFPGEIERYRQAGALCSRAMSEVGKSVQPGMTEHEISALMMQKVRSQGIDPIVVLVATDERTLKFRHPIPTAKPLENHAMLVLCGRYTGLIVSLTRMVHFGELSQELVDKHRAVCTVDACLNLETRPGAAVRDIFRQAVETYAATGFSDEWTLHHQGGGTGYGSRTFKGSPTCEEVVLENQAYAWNPSITGTKSEDTILATTRGPEFLSTPVDWPRVEVEWKGQKLQRADILIR